MIRYSRWYLDLAFVACWTGLAVLLVGPAHTGWVRVAAAVPFVTLFPGYVLLAALFPSVGTHETYTFDRNESGFEDPLPTKSGVDGTERFAFSVVLSVVVVAAVALVAHFTPWGVTLGPILSGVAGWTLLWTLVATVRRARLEPEARYVPRPTNFVAALRFSGGPGAAWGNETRSGLFDAALAVSVLLFASTLGYAAVNPPQESQSAGFTELYVEGQNVTGDVESTYPSRFAPGETRTLAVGVTNREQRPADYRLFLSLQRTDGGGRNATVLSEDRLDRRTLSLDHGERTAVSLPVTPTETGTDRRLVVLLYAGEPPGDPSLDTAYRSLLLPIDVTDDAGA